MGKLLSLIKTPKGIIALSLIIIILVTIPLTVFLVQNRQTLEQSAHTPSPSATSFCQGSEVVIAYTYTISGLPSGVTANVSVSDSQHFVTDSFTVTTSSPPVSKQSTTGKPSISAGVLTFQTTATDGFKKTNQVGYPQAGPCASPSPTPTNSPTPTLTPTPVPSATPTNTPTPTVTTTLTPTDTPIPSTTPTDTPVPSSTITPTNTLTPTDTPVPSVTPTIVVTTDTPTLTPTPTSTPVITSTPTPTITLPATGPNAIINVGLIGLVLLLIGGILIFAL